MTAEEFTSKEVERGIQEALNSGDDRLVMYLMWSRAAINHWFGWSL